MSLFKDGENPCNNNQSLNYDNCLNHRKVEDYR